MWNRIMYANNECKMYLQIINIDEDENMKPKLCIIYYILMFCCD